MSHTTIWPWINSSGGSGRRSRVSGKRELSPPAPLRLLQNRKQRLGRRTGTSVDARSHRWNRLRFSARRWYLGALWFLRHFAPDNFRFSSTAFSFGTTLQASIAEALVLQSSGLVGGGYVATHSEDQIDDFHGQRDLIFVGDTWLAVRVFRRHGVAPTYQLGGRSSDYLELPDRRRTRRPSVFFTRSWGPAASGCDRPRHAHLKPGPRLTPPVHMGARCALSRLTSSEIDEPLKVG